MTLLVDLNATNSKRAFARGLLQNFAVWLVVCSCSAGTAIVWSTAVSRSWPAMFLGILLFVFAYTWVTSTSGFHAWIRMPRVRKSFWRVYLFRMMITAVFPVGMALDLFTGMGARWIVLGDGPDKFGFWDTLLLTVTTGLLMHLPLAAIAPVVYAATWGKADRVGRAFEVVPLGSERDAD